MPRNEHKDEDREEREERIKQLMERAQKHHLSAKTDDGTSPTTGPSKPVKKTGQKK